MSAPRIAQRQDAVVPAPSGFQAIRAWPPFASDEDGVVDYDILPVIAFRFRGESNLIMAPVTPEGVPGDYFAVVGPDGRCWDNDREYENVEAFKRSFSEDWARDKARAAGQTA